MASRLAGLLLDADKPIVPPSCLVEFALLHRLGGDRSLWLERFIDLYGVKVAPMTVEISKVAVEAALRYGRGSGHAARLNFGDCLSYAYAKYLDLPLLFVGDDFRHTDVKQALTQRQSG